MKVDVSTLPFRKLEHYRDPAGFSTTQQHPTRVVSHPRLPSIDMLRGLVMVLMTLDHARDFFSASSFDPRDVNDPALFLTRWITHFCAPVFVFLAGVAAGLRGDELDETRTLSRFLMIRGFWLVVLEFTVVRTGWTFDPGGTVAFAQVIWALGVSMMALAALIHVPRRTLAVVAIALIVGHNLLDGIRVSSQDLTAWLFMIAHQPGVLRTESFTIVVLYPLIPWIGVMAAGYAMAPVMRWPAERRRRQLARLGCALTMFFIVLRLSNVYGDPQPWTPMQGDLVATLLSFVNVEKYPPSLLYLLMTIGPAVVVLALLDGRHWRSHPGTRSNRAHAAALLRRSHLRLACARGVSRLEQRHGRHVAARVVRCRQTARMGLFAPDRLRHRRCRRPFPLSALRVVRSAETTAA